LHPTVHCPRRDFLGEEIILVEEEYGHEQRF
jgi:hypothetical protein